MLDDGILPRVDSACACCIAKGSSPLSLIRMNILHFDAGNCSSKSPRLRDIFNMESQPHLCTVKPKDIIFHLFQIVTPHYSSHLENHVVMH